MSTELVVRSLAEDIVKSRNFAGIDVPQAVLKIQYGKELGVGPVASMNGIHTIQGKPTISAGLLAALIARSGKYKYRVREISAEICKIEFFEGAESIGVSTFTIAQAKKAGTKNMDKYPENMLYARAISNGAKWFCPDVFNGSVYTPEDFGSMSPTGTTEDESVTEDVQHEVVLPLLTVDHESFPKVLDAILHKGATGADYSKICRFAPDAIEAIQSAIKNQSNG